MKTVLFVCTGNICRSPMAEGILEKMVSASKVKDITVLSAGTHPSDGISPTKEAMQVMKKFGIDISNHRAVHIGRDLIRKADLILALEKKQKEDILELEPTAKGKVFLINEFAGNGELDIEDPIGQGLKEYEKCAGIIKGLLEKSLKEIISRD